MRILLLAVLLSLAGCDQLKERAGIPDPVRVEAEGKAIGGACRNAGRGLEDCYRLNGEASKAAIYAGWKEMNEYMGKNNMEVILPVIPPESLEPPPPPKKKSKKAGAEEGDGHEPAKGKAAEH